MDACEVELHQQFSAAHVVLAGDFNQRSDNDVAELTGHAFIVHRATRWTIYFASKTKVRTSFRQRTSAQNALSNEFSGHTAWKLA